jgi:glycine/D-amino acid oxidase-like deaminating enzyme
VIGGGLGGVAAALAAAEAGKRVVLSEATDWLGGQITSQGVSALDEHRYIESFGGTRSYYRLRDMIRAAYAEHYGVTAGSTPLNPGNGWVSALCFEPRIGLQVVERMLEPHIAAGRLRVLLEHVPRSVSVVSDRIRSPWGR